MVDHNIMRFHVAVHDALAVAVVEGLEELEDVVSDVEVVELGVEAAEVGVVDVLEDQRRCLALQLLAIIRNGILARGLGVALRVKVETGGETVAARESGNHLRVPDHIQQGDDVGAPGQVLKNLDLALDLLLLDGLENLDDTLLVVDDVDALEDLAVLSAPCIFGGRMFSRPILCRLISRIASWGRQASTNRSCEQPRSSLGRPSLCQKGMLAGVAAIWGGGRDCSLRHRELSVRRNSGGKAGERSRQLAEAGGRAGGGSLMLTLS